MHIDVALVSDEAGEMRPGVSLHGTWISHTSAAAAPEKAKNAKMMMQSMILRLATTGDIRIGT